MENAFVFLVFFLFLFWHRRRCRCWKNEIHITPFPITLKGFYGEQREHHTHYTATYTHERSQQIRARRGVNSPNGRIEVRFKINLFAALDIHFNRHGARNGFPVYFSRIHICLRSYVTRPSRLPPERRKCIYGTFVGFTKYYQRAYSIHTLTMTFTRLLVLNLNDTMNSRYIFNWIWLEINRRQ